MIKVIGVRFRKAGKVYYFDPLDFDIKQGSNVIVETARGVEYGFVVLAPKEVEEDKVIQPLKPAIRPATPEDDEIERANKEKEKEAFKVCLEKIRKHELEMKLIDCEYTFDNNKVLFYFTADGRIDFRELVKDLAAVFKTRIELRQIGVRDETKILGGIGVCGRPLCCHSYLTDFVPVSIKMAKEQNLSLNPTKISGVCGRLMCCLKHEEETYEDLNRNLPHAGDRVTCPDGVQGEVSSVNVLRQLVKVVVEKGDSKEIHEYKADDIRFVRKGHRQVKEEVSAEELRALELMEKQDKMDTEAEEKPAKGQRKERPNREERRERKERGERENREENKARGERESREERRERKERLRQERAEKESEKAESALTVPESRQEGVKEGAQERKERSDRKRRDRRERGRNREEQPADKTVEKEKQPVEEVQPAKAENTQQAEQISEKKEEGAREGGRNRKRNFYRNRRRNRPDGAKEQHES